MICYGSLLPDRVLQLPRFPRPGEGIHALGDQLYLGGEPCNVGGHLAAWNVPVAIAGNNLGCDEGGDFVLAQLDQRPHTLAITKRDPDVRTPTCYIWTTPDGERTIVPSWPTPTGWTLPDAELLQAARLVSASIYGPGMDETLRLARQYRRPLAVSDISGPDDERLGGAVIVATSRAVLHHRWNVDDIAAWMRAVHAASGAQVVVSDGAGLLHALTPDGSALNALPPTITPVDTTGAGDALKAGLILGWLNAWPIERTLRWAIAAASLQCLRHGACASVPPAVEIEDMMPMIDVNLHQRSVGGRS